MADLKISDLPVLLAPDLDGTDPLALADLSASETRRLDAKSLVQEGVSRLIDDSSIPGAKLATDSVTALQIAPDAITDSELADNAVDTAALQDAAVTDAKVAFGIDGQKLTSDTVTASKIPAASLDRGIDKSTGQIGHTNAVSAATMSGVTYDGQGHVTQAVRLVGADLPPATDAVLGAVVVPADSGLTVSPVGVLDHQNNVVAGSVSGVTYDDHGHIVTAVPLVGTDLPLATTTTIGGVSVPGPGLQVDGLGVLIHVDSAVAPGVYPKVTVDQKGHVIDGTVLAAADIPSLDASKINTGTFDVARIADDSITKEKLADYAGNIIQEGDPGQGDYKGQFWYRESDAQLRTWSGNSWIPVGFGRLSQENLRFCGTFDAATGIIDQVTSFGTQAGMARGGAVPAATDALAGAYLVATTPGVFNTKNYDNGDWTLCLGASTGWERVDTLSSAGGGSIKIEDLLDTTITGAASGDTLIYDASIGKWVNKATAAQKATFVEAIDGVRTSFTLSRDGGSVNNILISLGGVLQEPGGDFTFAAPRTVNFSGPPPAGIEYWALIEGVSSTGGGGGGGGTALPHGTAAEEVLQWSPTLSAWQPAAVIQMGTY